MNVVTHIHELKEWIKHHQEKQHSIGFVPTMGFLHEGHLTLAKEARDQNDVVVMSIFVNPLQFGPNEDFESYPRDMKRDQRLAEEAGVDILFTPDVKEMYPNDPSITMTVQKRTDVLCGKKRPGHFDGVVTVLTKLFHLVVPTNVYFGLKDAQQVAVIDAMIKDFFFDLHLVSVPTVREENGLAKSSRNVYLSEKERQEAPALYRALKKGQSAVEKGERDVSRIYQLVEEEILQTSGEIDYIEIYSYPELEPLQQLAGQVIIAIAVKFSRARLIDNVIFHVPESGEKHV
ncbi:pantoate--beta-alanine ligase [Bacillus pumilus]|uniref:pantoate--beta-alanine ligase n=1 Tax=Bacillus pumilus TaxID=1408 RepID=UPI0004A0EB3B|nr:pantoate--beta-alanine ligase [Bacillus pumilus]QKN78363.1 pantoate--beta-alanine ligase [Bacillus pumilus]QLI45676.1 pantoate--beta-alanine ligase [Bacillus pumilus]